MKYVKTHYFETSLFFTKKTVSITVLLTFSRNSYKLKVTKPSSDRLAGYLPKSLSVCYSLFWKRFNSILSPFKKQLIRDYFFSTYSDISNWMCHISALLSSSQGWFSETSFSTQQNLPQQHFHLILQNKAQTHCDRRCAKTKNF